MITPKPGYIVDPNNPNGVIPDPNYNPSSGGSSTSSLQAQLDSATKAVQGLQTGLNAVTGTTYTPADYSAALSSHPTVAAAVAAGASLSDIENAYATGDWSGLTNVSGQPFSAADQANALATATSQTQPYYDAEQASDTEGTANTLGGDQLDYNKTLTDNATQFQTDKTNQDQTAADQGVLFSGGRAQKLATLAKTYQSTDAYNQAKYGNSIANTAGNYAYKYGSSAAGNPTLSQYYQLGSQNYNPYVASGGVTPGGLSTIYNAGNYAYQGTETNAAKSAAQTAAAGLLANQSNKLAGSPTTSLS